MKKRTYGIAAVVLLMGLVAAAVAWKLSSGAPSYERIVGLNDQLKQARQLGLSTQAKIDERLGSAILKTTDESLLANLLANNSFEERFAHAILDKIKTPETIEAVARTFKVEILANGSNVQGSPTFYDAILDRLPNDDVVERVVEFRLGEFGGDSDARTNARRKDASGKSDFAASLLRRILAMDDKERAESLMEKMTDSGGFRALLPVTRLGIALRTKNENIRRATGVDQATLDLGDLVAKWDPDCLSRSVREIVDRGREIKDAQRYVEIVERFDPDFRSNDIDSWVEYANSVQPLLAAIDRLSASAGADSADSDRRNRLAEQRDNAEKTLDELKKMIDEVRTAIDKNDFATIMAACKYTGVYFDASDPDGTGYRLGSEIRKRYQRAQNEIQTAEREISALDRVSSQREKTNNEISKLKSRLEQIRQYHETLETRKAREDREASELKAKELALAWKRKTKTVPVSDSVAIKLRSVPGNLWFGKYEVTQVQWEAVMGENPSRFKDPDNPVETVSWDDCQEFLKKVNALPSVKKTGLVFRLPTDAEWEAACRAGATGTYCLLADGTEITEGTLGNVAWFEDNSDMVSHSVGQKMPNAWGLYDTLGNVWEWTATADGESRIYRGGGWDGSTKNCEASFRSGFSPSLRGSSLGFRLCASSRVD